MKNEQKLNFLMMTKVNESMEAITLQVVYI